MAAVLDDYFLDFGVGAPIVGVLAGVGDEFICEVSIQTLGFPGMVSSAFVESGHWFFRMELSGHKGILVCLHRRAKCVTFNRSV